MLRIIMLYLLATSKALTGFQSYINYQINREVAPTVLKAVTLTITNPPQVYQELKDWQLKITYRDSRDLQI